MNGSLSASNSIPLRLETRRPVGRVLDLVEEENRLPSRRRHLGGPAPKALPIARERHFGCVERRI
jgi:hypothetical protein